MADGDRDDERRRAAESDREGGVRLGFSLPPIRLPESAFPSDLRVELPAPGWSRFAGISGRSVLAVALAVDLVDAALALAGVGPVLDWGRVLGGLVVAAALGGITGSLYAWEAVAVGLGVGWVTVIPSLTLVLLLLGGRTDGSRPARSPRPRRHVDLLRGGHPEQVDGDPEAER